ncbi:MAG: transglutaminase-like cysteine peptidase [Campylobacterota bacterium]|nr:transglutaminase-like cysteine peptidase [Campylobacterota bacterium]
MKTILLFFILFSSIVYSDPFTLNKNDEKVIKNHFYHSQIVARYKQFNNFIKTTKKYNEIKKLNRVNSFINRILPEHDAVAQNNEDHWSTPKEFLINGRGDCEEYAITKYFTLTKLGIQKQKLYLAIVKVQRAKGMHMVLLYFKTPNSIPLVLDNLSWRVLHLNKRKDLKVKVLFNEVNNYTLKNNLLDKKVNIEWGKLNRWEDILNRINLGK